MNDRNMSVVINRVGAFFLCFYCDASPSSYFNEKYLTHILYKSA